MCIKMGRYKMKQLQKGEAASRTFTPGANNQVTLNACVSRDGDEASLGIRQQLTGVVLDFSGCSQEEILGLAAKTAWITLQRQWRTADAKTQLDGAAWEKVHDVKKDILDTQRVKKTDAEKAKSAFDKMDATEKKAFLEMLKA